MNSVLRYTSRTFNTIMTDINSNANLVDKPDWFKKIMAGVGDMLAQYTNAQANNSYLRTAFTRKAIVDLLALIDYQLANRTTAVGELTFYIDRTQTFPISFLKTELIGNTRGSITQSSAPYQADADVTVATFSETAVVTLLTNLLAVAHDYTTGDLVRISSTVALPSPLQANTDYYVIRLGATTIQLCSSLNNAFNNIPIVLSDLGTGVHTLKLWSFQATASQLKYADSISIGTSDGTAWQSFALPDLNILEDTISITVAGLPGWTAVTTFVTSTPIDKHYKILYDDAGNCSVEFGDGTYGSIPTGDVQAVYAVGGGSNSNVSTLNQIVSYTGGSAKITGVTNTSVFNGGGEFETVDSAKVLAPLLLKSRDRFVTTSDGQALAVNYGGVIKAKVNKNVYGILSAQVVIVPSGGGTPSAGLKSALQTYLINKTVLESIDVRVVDPSYVTVALSASMKMETGYLWASVEPYFMLACRLFFSERGEEIQSTYNSTGIAAAVAMINSEWTTTFGVTDYGQIENLIKTENYTPIEFGEDVQESHLFAYLQDNIEGCSYVLITAPAFPIVLNGDQITTDGVMTLTEII